MPLEYSSGDVPAALRDVAYRVVQEALTNAMKHAAGSAVTVRLAVGDGGLEVEVRDAAAARRLTAAHGTHRRHRARRTARLLRPLPAAARLPRRWAVIFPIQTVVVHAENADDINAVYFIVNAAILVGGVELNKLGARLRRRRVAAV